MRKRVIDLTSATATLGKNQSDSLIVLSRAAGIVVTLPKAGRGLRYDFVVKTAVTSNRYDIKTAVTADKIRGTLVMGQNNAAKKTFVATASNDIQMNGGTTGGLRGTNFSLVCDEDGVWTVSGCAESSSTEATPFA